ncbi:hypothetical protein U8C32_22295 (plasmid) [Sinorhizobium medicae]|nr:hypothetical protein [Sinorhizobium medicae]WQO48312.1 hypothetical protein U8C42_22400 [Sinorhizobium medicae]WQO75764.1 hypothetical protein U8C31_23410 [Sinorhizobium medicae]WQO94930.1 hypothetical protein U8C32_22295 [Sinorhizobium medicae]
MPTTRRRPSALAGAELPHPWRAKVKASAVIVRSAASFIVLPFDGGSDIVAALPVDPGNDGGDDSETGRSHDEARSRTSNHRLDLFRDGLPIGVLAPVEEAGHAAERDKDQEEVLSGYAADLVEQRKCSTTTTEE